MVIDTSAVIAILLGEPGADRLLGAVSAAPDRLMSSASLVECGLVLQGRLGAGAESLVYALCAAQEITIHPLTTEQARIAIAAHSRFGRGSGSRARLNFGDCCTYALAKATHQELLFVGDDFTHTDLNWAPW